MNGGRPIRFLIVILFGWTLLRVAALWPSIDTIAAMAVASPAEASERPRFLRRNLDQNAHLARQPAPPLAERPLSQIAAVATPVQGQPHITARATAIASSPVRDRIAVAVTPPPLAPPPLAKAPSRLAISAWAIARGGADDALLGGQLGASQAGIRATYALGESRRVAIAARIASPFRGQGREAAIGLDWQPTRAPLHVVVEQRIAIDGGRGGPSASVIGGIGPSDLARGFKLEAYGQAGAIKRDRVDGFADGSARISRAVARVGAVSIDAGVGAWGGAQRGAARIDLGPSVGAIVPVARRAIRLSMDWRQRIAGNARPGSGPAISIGSDF